MPKVKIGASFDILTDGGFESGFFYEVYGPSGVGKTQLLFTLAVEGVHQGFSRAYFIDTRGTFRPERVAEIAEARGYNRDDVLTKISVKQLRDLPSFILTIDLLSEGGKELLLLVDTLSDLFYEFPDVGVRYKLGILARNLSLTCIERGFLVVASNGVRYKGNLEPLGSEYTDPYVHIRIAMEKDDRGTLYACREGKEEKLRYVIGRGGIE